MEGTCWYCKKIGHPWFKCFSRPEGWAPPGMKPPSGERAQGGAVQGSGAQGEGAQGNAYPGLFVMVEDVHGHEGDVGSVGKVVMHPLTHWVIDSGCTSHMTPRADLLDEVKPPGKIKYVAAASGALLPVIGVGNAKVKGANGELVGLGNVLLVEGLSANLLSVRRLQKSKAEVTFGPTSCRAKLGKKQNGVAERFNRTLQEGARTLLGRAGLPDPFWVSALRQVALVKNRVLATVGDKEWIPYTKWYGSAPAVNMLRAFGCMVVFHVPKEKRGKLEASGRWAEVEQQQQHESPSRVPHPPERPRRDVRPPVRLTYGGRGKPNVVQAGSVVEQIEEDEIAHCYWAPIPEPKTREEALNGPNGEKWKATYPLMRRKP
ncbi:hypothetical protein CLOM_g21787 [Closterium sp. NIES-68]|nr:hypothetical protein CLOM_g21787 [Closterium sp. NIES-68]